MPINKVVYGSTTLLDLTDSTLSSADQLMQGVTAYDRTGTKLTGTGTSGGGSVTQDQDGYIVLPDDGGGGGGSTGLVYESGTWTPSEDTINPTINFTNTHTNPPFSIVFYDATGTLDSTTNVSIAFVWSDYSQTGNENILISSTKTEYARAYYTARTSATAVTAWSYSINYPYSNTSATIDTYYRYWVTESSFKPSANSTTRYWMAGRTYKWIAVWLPTT